MSNLPDLPTDGIVRVVGLRDAGTGFVVSADGLIVTCAHILTGSVIGATVRIEPHASNQPLWAVVLLLQDPPDVAVLRLTTSLPSQVQVLQLGSSPSPGEQQLRTFGYPKFRQKAGLPGQLTFNGFTNDAGYRQLALRSEEATLGFSGAPIWDSRLCAVVGMIKSIVRGDPGARLSNTAVGVPVENIRRVCPELELPDRCPYRGLEPFTEEHVDYYFGRESAIGHLLTSLVTHHFVPVVAASGRGKSSLLRAGLAKGLQDRSVMGLAERVRCYVRIGREPHAMLLNALAQQGIEPSQSRPGYAESHPRPEELAPEILNTVCPNELILIVDQFERLYTDCEAGERKRFIELLSLLASERIKIIVGLRADFYALALDDMGERIAVGQVALPPMSEEDLHRAIVAPGEKLFRSFQPGLAEQLISEVRGRAGDLPLLQFALTELWERDAATGVLTWDGYRSLGVNLPEGRHLPGVQGALIRRAEKLWRELDSANQLGLQRVLLNLIAALPAGATVADVVGTRDITRQARISEWVGEDQLLIQRLIEARLLTAGEAVGNGQPTVEVSHEALIRGWPRLQGWLQERSGFVQWRARDLGPYLERWIDHGRVSAFLLPKLLMNQALRWLKDHPEDLAGPAAEYIKASERHYSRRQRQYTALVASVVLVSVLVAGIFFAQRQTAEEQRRIATGRGLVAEANAARDSDPTISLMLGIAAMSVAPTPDAQASLITTLTRTYYSGTLAQGGGSRAVVFAPDGKTLATLNKHDGSVLLLDTSDRHTTRLATLEDKAGVDSVAFTPDTKTLVTADGFEDVVVLWDITDRAHPARLATLPRHRTDAQQGTELAIASDGRTLVTAGDDGIVLWDITDRTHPRRLRILQRPRRDEYGVPEVAAIASDGRTLVTAGDDGIVLWDITDRTHPTRLTTLPQSVGTSRYSELALSSDGRTLATLDLSRVTLWDTTDQSHPTRLATLSDNNNSIRGVALSPDGQRLSTINHLGTVVLWSTPHRAHPIRLAAFPHQAERSGTQSRSAMAFGSGGRTLATAGNSGTTLWETTDRGRPSRLTTLDAQGGSIASTPNGKTLVTGDWDNTALWDITNRAHPTRLATLPTPREDIEKWSGNGAPPPPVETYSVVAISPDGNSLATARNDGKVALWDITNPHHPTRQASLPRPDYDVHGLAFGPDGRTLATVSSDGGDGAVLWDTTNRSHPTRLATLDQSSTLDQSGKVTRVAFASDGRTLATAHTRDVVMLWDITDRSHPASLGTLPSPRDNPSPRDKKVYSLGFGPDGKTLATSGSGGTALWDTTDRSHPTRLATLTQSREGHALAFTADGLTLAYGNGDGAILWDLTERVRIVTHLVDRACSITGRGLDQGEWVRYAPGLPYRRTCPG